MVITCETNSNTAHQSVESRKADASSGHNVSYDATGDNWYVISWAEGNTIYYVKEYVTNDQFNRVEFKYSRSDAGNQLLESIIGSFQLK